MIGTTRVSRPSPAKTGVFPLDDGRWAYFVDGLVRFVEHTQEACAARARVVGWTPE